MNLVSLKKKVFENFKISKTLQEPPTKQIHYFKNPCLRVDFGRREISEEENRLH